MNSHYWVKSMNVFYSKIGFNNVVVREENALYICQMCEITTWACWKYGNPPKTWGHNNIWTVPNVWRIIIYSLLRLSQFLIASRSPSQVCVKCKLCAKQLLQQTCSRDFKFTSKVCQIGPQMRPIRDFSTFWLFEKRKSGNCPI